jgi:hypothetical protein
MFYAQVHAQVEDSKRILPVSGSGTMSGIGTGSDVSSGGIPLKV